MSCLVSQIILANHQHVLHTLLLHIEFGHMDLLFIFYMFDILK